MLNTAMADAERPPKRDRGRPTKDESGVKKVQFSAYLDPQLLKELKQYALDNDTSVSDLIESATRQWWDPHPMRQFTQRKVAMTPDEPEPPAERPRGRRKK
jgi:hypothetical protein